MFEKAVEQVLKLEGDYSNNKSDRGKATNMGITEAVARENGYTGDMVALPLETAKAIYKKCYWDKMMLDDVAALSYDIAWELFNIGVNQGVSTAVKMLQRALNCTRDNKLIVDGIMGSQTQHALSYCFGVELIKSDIVLKMLKAQQILRYMEIVENNQSQAVFLNGWLNRITGAVG